MTASAGAIEASEEAWIACLGETRTISEGRVVCPLRDGERVIVEDCWDCHLLTWRSGERDLADPCGTQPD